MASNASVQTGSVANATPVGDYVNDNIMVVTNMICMENREEAFEKAVSIGMFVPPGQPVVWRGPMLHRAIEQFFDSLRVPAQ